MSGCSTQRVSDAASAIGLEISIKVMSSSTRTAEDAAQACGCQLGQIVKSLVFVRNDTMELVLLLIAGDRQADLSAAAEVVGAPLLRAEPKLVREVTGFAIGGVAPIGHETKIPVFIDPALLEHEIVWAAAGAPNAVFSVDPKLLQTNTHAQTL